MTAQHVDAVSSFVYLTDNVPSWLAQLANVSRYATQKNSEFVTEYKQLVHKVRNKRRKSASLQSIHSDQGEEPRIPEVSPQELPAPPHPTELDPTEDGHKYLYAQQFNRKRKLTSSVRSGASGPQKFRSRNQVVVYYDSHVQNELDTMVKAIGLARNNLRKGRNSLKAAQGFQLPTLGKRFDTSSIDSLRATAISRTNPALPSAKYMPRSAANQAPTTPEEEHFASADSSLESVQSLYETAAHQFLRDGDCRSELDDAQTKLEAVLIEATSARKILESLAEEQKRKDEAAHLQPDSDATDSASDFSQQTPPVIGFDPLAIVTNKFTPSTLSQTLDDMKHRTMLSPAPTGGGGGGIIAALPTAGVEIEVDTDDDGESIGEIDMSQFRTRGRVGLTR